MRKKTLCYPAKYKNITNLDDMHVLLSRNDVANLFQVTEVTIDNWIRSGDLKAIKLGNVVRISRDYIKQLMEGKQC